ncbi:MAG: hypothetical protein EBU75_04265 [Betaproteobacteria bacterium]|jgi:hypothetical protein|nr:hypothetical protein [Betaproteobacteria bacterium]
MIRPLSGLGYLASAALMGGALGLLRGPAAIAVNPALLLIPFSLAATIQFFGSKAAPALSRGGLSWGGQLQSALMIGLPLAALVLASESILVADWPSAAAAAAGCGAGVVAGLVVEPMSQTATSFRIRVLLLYLAAGVVAISTLLTSLPPAAFWVVSAVIPAWQARRLALRDQAQDAARMLAASIRLFMGVLTLALVLPAGLMLR